MIRFYFDENLPEQLAAVGRALGLDAISSHALGNDGMSDELQLTYAIAQRRCIVTLDRKDYPRLAAELADRGVQLYGVLILPGSVQIQPANYVRIARALKQYADRYPNGIVHVDWLRLGE